MKSLSLFLSMVFVISFQGIANLDIRKPSTKRFSPVNLAFRQEIAHNLMEIKKRNFQIASNLLRRKGIPFNPELLLQDGWKDSLAPIFDQMPEMQEVCYVDTLRGGVELADTLYVPEKVRLTGDVVIVAKLRRIGQTD